MSKPWRRERPSKPALDLTCDQQLVYASSTPVHWLAYTPCSPFKEQLCAPRAVSEPKSSVATPATAPVTPTTPPASARALAYVWPEKEQRMLAYPCEENFLTESTDWFLRYRCRGPPGFLRSQRRYFYFWRQGTLLHAPNYEHVQQVREHLGGAQQHPHRDDRAGRCGQSAVLERGQSGRSSRRLEVP